MALPIGSFVPPTPADLVDQDAFYDYVATLPTDVQALDEIQKLIAIEQPWEEPLSADVFLSILKHNETGFDYSQALQNQAAHHGDVSSYTDQIRSSASSDTTTAPEPPYSEPTEGVYPDPFSGQLSDEDVFTIVSNPVLFEEYVLAYGLEEAFMDPTGNLLEVSPEALSNQATASAWFFEIMNDVYDAGGTAWTETGDANSVAMAEAAPDLMMGFEFALSDPKFVRWLYDGMKGLPGTVVDPNGGMVVQAQAFHQATQDGEFNGFHLSTQQGGFLAGLFLGQTIVFDQAGHVLSEIHSDYKAPSPHIQELVQDFFNACGLTRVNAGDGLFWDYGRFVDVNVNGAMLGDEAKIEEVLRSIASPEEMRAFRQAVELSFKAVSVQMEGFGFESKGQTLEDILASELSGRKLGRMQAIVRAAEFGDEYYTGKAYGKLGEQVAEIKTLQAELQGLAVVVADLGADQAQAGGQVGKADAAEFSSKQAEAMERYRQIQTRLVEKLGSRVGQWEITAEQLLAADPVLLMALLASTLADDKYQDVTALAHHTDMGLGTQERGYFDDAFDEFKADQDNLIYHIKHQSPMPQDQLAGLNHSMGMVYKEFDIFVSQENAGIAQAESVGEAGEMASYAAIGAAVAICTAGVATMAMAGTTAVSVTAAGLVVDGATAAAAGSGVGAGVTGASMLIGGAAGTYVETEAKVYYAEQKGETITSEQYDQMLRASAVDSFGAVLSLGVGGVVGGTTSRAALMAEQTAQRSAQLTNYAAKATRLQQATLRVAQAAQAAGDTAKAARYTARAAKLAETAAASTAQADSLAVRAVALAEGARVLATPVVQGAATNVGVSLANQGLRWDENYSVGNVMVAGASGVLGGVVNPRLQRLAGSRQSGLAAAGSAGETAFEMGREVGEGTAEEFVGGGITVEGMAGSVVGSVSEMGSASPSRTKSGRDAGGGSAGRRTLGPSHAVPVSSPEPMATVSTAPTAGARTVAAPTSATLTSAVPTSTAPTAGVRTVAAPTSATLTSVAPTSAAPTAAEPVTEPPRGAALRQDASVVSRLQAIARSGSFGEFEIYFDPVAETLRFVSGERGRADTYVPELTVDESGNVLDEHTTADTFAPDPTWIPVGHAHTARPDSTLEPSHDDIVRFLQTGASEIVRLNPATGEVESASLYVDEDGEVAVEYSDPMADTLPGRVRVQRDGVRARAELASGEITGLRAAAEPAAIANIMAVAVKHGYEPDSDTAAALQAYLAAEINAGGLVAVEDFLADNGALIPSVERLQRVMGRYLNLAAFAEAARTRARIRAHVALGHSDLFASPPPPGASAEETAQIRASGWAETERRAGVLIPSILDVTGEARVLSIDDVRWVAQQRDAYRQAAGTAVSGDDFEAAQIIEGVYAGIVVADTSADDLALRATYSARYTERGIDEDFTQPPDERVPGLRTVDHHGPYGKHPDGTPDPRDATQKLLDIMERALEDANGNADAAAERLSVSDVATDNLGDAMWCTWILRNQQRVLRDPALRALIRAATQFEDFTAFGTEYDTNDPAVVLQAAIFNGFNRIVRDHNITGGMDRFMPRQAGAIADEAGAHIEAMLADPTERELQALEFWDGVDKAVTRARDQALIADAGDPALFNVYDMDPMQDLGLFERWLALPRAHDLNLQVTTQKGAVVGSDKLGVGVSSRKFLIAVPNGRALPSGKSLMELKSALEAAEVAKAEAMGVTLSSPTLWLGREAVIFPVPGSLLTPQELAAILADPRHGLFNAPASGEQRFPTMMFSDEAGVRRVVIDPQQEGSYGDSVSQDLEHSATDPHIRTHELTMDDLPDATVPIVGRRDEIRDMPADSVVTSPRAEPAYLNEVAALADGEAFEASLAQSAARLDRALARTHRLPARLEEAHGADTDGPVTYYDFLALAGAYDRCLKDMVQNGVVTPELGARLSAGRVKFLDTVLAAQPDTRGHIEGTAPRVSRVAGPVEGTAPRVALAPPADDGTAPRVADMATRILAPVAEAADTVPPGPATLAVAETGDTRQTDDAALAAMQTGTAPARAAPDLEAGVSAATVHAQIGQVVDDPLLVRFISPTLEHLLIEISGRVPTPADALHVAQIHDLVSRASRLREHPKMPLRDASTALIANITDLISDEFVPYSHKKDILSRILMAQPPETVAVKDGADKPNPADVARLLKLWEKWRRESLVLSERLTADLEAVKDRMLELQMRGDALGLSPEDGGRLEVLLLSEQLSMATKEALLSELIAAPRTGQTSAILRDWEARIRDKNPRPVMPGRLNAIRVRIPAATTPATTQTQGALLAHAGMLATDPKRYTLQHGLTPPGRGQRAPKAYPEMDAALATTVDEDYYQAVIQRLTPAEHATLSEFAAFLGLDAYLGVMTNPSLLFSAKKGDLTKLKIMLATLDLYRGADGKIDPAQRATLSRYFSPSGKNSFSRLQIAQRGAKFEVDEQWGLVQEFALVSQLKFSSDNPDAFVVGEEGRLTYKYGERLDFDGFDIPRRTIHEAKNAYGTIKMQPNFDQLEKYGETARKSPQDVTAIEYDFVVYDNGKNNTLSSQLLTELSQRIAALGLRADQRVVVRLFSYRTPDASDPGGSYQPQLQYVFDQAGHYTLTAQETGSQISAGGNI